MQNWEDYEADYFRREPDGYEAEADRDDDGWGVRRDERLCPVDRYGRKRCMDDQRMNRKGNGEKTELWEGYATDTAMEMIRDMDEFEKLMGTVGRELLQIIRRMCDSMDGDVCIAMDGMLTPELRDMLVDRVLEEMETAEQMDRELIAQLLYQEMLRRRHRRRYGQRRPFTEIPRKRLQF